MRLNQRVCSLHLRNDTNQAEDDLVLARGQKERGQTGSYNRNVDSLLPRQSCYDSHRTSEIDVIDGGSLRAPENLSSFPFRFPARRASGPRATCAWISVVPERLKPWAEENDCLKIDTRLALSSHCLARLVILISVFQSMSPDAHENYATKSI